MKVTELPKNWRKRVKLMRPLTPEVRGRCWVWQGAQGRGYAVAQADGKLRILHLVTLEMVGRPKPAGLESDHLCNRSLCINPHHIEYVTKSENNLRAYRRGRTHWQARKTHCKHGHAFTPENTVPSSGGRATRQCRTCKLEAEKMRKRRVRAAA